MSKKNKWLVPILVAALMCMTVSPAFVGTVQAQEDATVIPSAEGGAEDPGTTDADYWDGDSYIVDGEKATGLLKIDGKFYYFDSAGVLVKNRVALQIKTGGATGYYKIAANGVATKWTGTAELAAKRLIALKASPAKVTSSTRLAALKKAFLWSAKLKYVGNTKKLSGSKALKYYGNYGFTKMRGDCNTKATTFYWMAKVLGYNVKVVKGYIPKTFKNGKYTNFQAHTWASVKFGSKWYGFDPEFNMSTDAKKLRKKNKYVGFKFRYGQKGTYAYHNSKKKLLK